MKGALHAAAVWGRMVKLSHTLFALPFALAAAALAAARAGIEPRQVVWILVAMFAARNAAMGFNRLVDRQFDAANPRTADRELPAGRLSPGAVWAFTVALTALFVVAAFRLNPLCGALSPVALAIVFGYSFTKRFTWASHLVLGLSLAIAPVGAWVAVTGGFSAVAWIMGLAVLLWVAGFDTIYACQDEVFDRETGLRSIPARFGPRRALLAARLFHAAALVALAAVGPLADLPSAVYFAGWAVVAVVLARQHRLVRADDLSRVGLAFFNVNGTVSVLYLVVVLASLLGPRLLGGT